MRRAILAALLVPLTVYSQSNTTSERTIDLPSGAGVIVHREGTGPLPKTTSVVKVHYRGTLDNGTEFDSSYARGKPAEFRLNQVIPCWTESLSQLRVGAKATLLCPAATAYGERGAPPKIGANEDLIFEVELLDILG